MRTALKIIFYLLLLLQFVFFGFAMWFAQVWGISPLILLLPFMLVLFLYGFATLLVWLALNIWEQKRTGTISG